MANAFFHAQKCSWYEGIQLWLRTRPSLNLHGGAGLPLPRMTQTPSKQCFFQGPSFWATILPDTYTWCHILSNHDTEDVSHGLFLLERSQTRKNSFFKLFEHNGNRDTARGLCQKGPQSKTELLLHIDVLVSWWVYMIFKIGKRAVEKGGRKKKERLNKWIQTRKCWAKNELRSYRMEVCDFWTLCLLADVRTAFCLEQRKSLSSFINNFRYIKYDHFILSIISLCEMVKHGRTRKWTLFDTNTIVQNY